MTFSGSKRDMDAVKRHWNDSAALGSAAGTRDLLAKQLEIAALCPHLRAGQRILEMGCGNGLTAIEIARRFEVEIVGLDYAENMIADARQMAIKETLAGQVRFEVGDVNALPADIGYFDIVITERVLINLADRQHQFQAIAALTGLLRPGGAYLMCENSQDGLDRINDLRQQAGLERISPPWHNLYFHDADLTALAIPGVALENVDNYSATYYFLSRVVNAWLAKNEGIEPRYDAPVNQLALLLPAMGDTAQGKLWVWRKEG